MPIKPIVKMVDLGYTGASDFWTKNVLPAYKRYQEARDSPTALDVSIHLWHLREWVWHDPNCGQQRKQGINAEAFYANLRNDCLALGWLRDIANAGKHRVLNKPTKVQRAFQAPNIVTFGGDPLTFNGEPVSFGNTLEIELDDGTRQSVCDAIFSVVKFWIDEFGFDPPPIP